MKEIKKSSNKFIKGNTCLNCEKKLDVNDNYCSECGQANDSSRVSFKHLIYDIFGYFFFYDYKLKNSLKQLLFHPGKLSLHFINGKKADYIHPIRLFFIVSLIYFSLSTLYDSINNTKQVDIVSLDTLDKDIEEDPSNFYALLNITDSTTIDSALILKAQSDNVSLFKLTLIELKSNKKITPETLFNKYSIDDSIINNFVFKKAVEFSTVNLDDFFGIIDRKFKILLFLFMPLFASFLFLLHYKKDIYYYEHLIFAFNTQTALFLILIFAESLAFIIPSIGVYIVFITNIIIFPIYLFFALKEFYNYKSYLKTIIMFIIINSVFFISSIIFFLFTLVFLFVVF